MEQKTKSIMDIDVNSDEFKAEAKRWKALSEFAASEALFNKSVLESETSKYHLRQFYAQLQEAASAKKESPAPKKSKLSKVENAD